ncbi:MAG: NTP transferase domain-containing protein [Candidatus Methylomirabilales bacterium]
MSHSAILLAAGIGRRLAPLTDRVPKCLVEFDGVTLLRRHLEILTATGIHSVTIVVGHLAEKIQDHVAELPISTSVRFIRNERYAEGSIRSLHAAREALVGNCLIMDADVLYPRALLQRLVGSQHPNCLLMDPVSTDTGEEMKLALRGGRAIALARSVEPPWEQVGEGIGFLKVGTGAAPALRAALEDLVAQGKRGDYEDAIDLWLKEAWVGVEEVGGLPWIEIDFPEDLERARTIWPAIRAIESQEKR